MASKKNIWIIAALLIGGLTACGGESYGPDNPMPLDVAAGIVLDYCADWDEGPRSSYSSGDSSLEKCIERSSLLLSNILDEEGTSVIDGSGEFVRSYMIRTTIEQRAVAMAG